MLMRFLHVLRRVSLGLRGAATSWRPSHLPPKHEQESEHHRSLAKTSDLCSKRSGSVTRCAQVRELERNAGSLGNA